MCSTQKANVLEKREEKNILIRVSYFYGIYLKINIILLFFLVLINMFKIRMCSMF